MSVLCFFNLFKVNEIYALTHFFPVFPSTQYFTLLISLIPSTLTRRSISSLKYSSCLYHVFLTFLKSMKYVSWSMVLLWLGKPLFFFPCEETCQTILELTIFYLFKDCFFCCQSFHRCKMFFSCKGWNFKLVVILCNNREILSTWSVAEFKYFYGLFTRYEGY